MKKTKVILFGIYALIWSVKAGYELIETPHPTTGTLLILDVVCAMCWIIAFIVAAKRYRAGKDED